MNKKIEDLARKYAEEMCPKDKYDIEDIDDRQADLVYYYGEAKEVLAWMFNQPIPDRLTDTEREQTRATERGFKRIEQ